MKNKIINMLNKMNSKEIKNVFKEYAVYINNVKNNYEYFLKIKYHTEKIIRIIKEKNNEF